MFMGIIAMLGAPTHGDDGFRTLAFDCTAPTDIKVYDRNVHCKYSQEIYRVETSTHILQNVAAETMQGLKCQVTVHRKLYYCGLFSYSKPILSAEWEETMIISAQSYAKVARTNTFITPQGRKIEPVNVPGKL